MYSARTRDIEEIVEIHSEFSNHMKRRMDIEADHRIYRDILFGQNLEAEELHCRQIGEGKMAPECEG